MIARTYTLAALGGLALAAGNGLAQVTPSPQDPPQPPPPQERQVPPPQPQPQMQPQVDVSDAQVEKFAEIFVDVQETRDELSRELQEAESAPDAQQLQERMRNAIAATIQDHGWTIEKYNRIATAINNDPDTREQALEVINELSS